MRLPRLLVLAYRHWLGPLTELVIRLTSVVCYLNWFWQLLAQSAAIQRMNVMDSLLTPFYREQRPLNTVIQKNFNVDPYYFIYHLWFSCFSTLDWRRKESCSPLPWSSYSAATSSTEAWMRSCAAEGAHTASSRLTGTGASHCFKKSIFPTYRSQNC